MKFLTGDSRSWFRKAIGLAIICAVLSVLAYSALVVFFSPVRYVHAGGKAWKLVSIRCSSGDPLLLIDDASLRFVEQNIAQNPMVETAQASGLGESVELTLTFSNGFIAFGERMSALHRGDRLSLCLSPAPATFRDPVFIDLPLNDDSPEALRDFLAQKGPKQTSN